MESVIEKLKEIQTGEVGISIYSESTREMICSWNSGLIVPLASAAKVGIGFCIAKWVEEEEINWNDLVEPIRFNPNEDSDEIYPHLQNRNSLMLRDAVEVMIACHDRFVANAVVRFCGGWEKVNESIQSYFIHMNITEEPRDPDNLGKLSEMLELMRLIFHGYRNDPELWKPIINGLVRQRDEIEGIPARHLNHMTGGLENVAVDIGILGDFSKEPILYVLGARNLLNRYKEKAADEKMHEAMRLLYEEYKYFSCEK
ncbi:serine hydrolase [Bacillus sp. JJ1122]|uniref:serine hydrolase n=1 Tax=Bacillus sp. JJ1122 TaxID=3122951 RepID=UPI00300049FA